MVTAAVLFDQSRGDWEGMNCLWSQFGKPYQLPELISAQDQADCYLVITTDKLAALVGLALVSDKMDFDPDKPVIWIDHDRQVADIFGCISQLIVKLRKEECETERNIKRLIARLLVS